MAPIIPFLTEYIWNNTVAELEPSEPQSIHLASFPEAKEVDETLLTMVEEARQIIYLGLKIRNENKIKIKQPLKTLYIKGGSDFIAAGEFMKEQIMSELNVKEIEAVESDDKFNTRSLVLNFRKAGAVLRKDVNTVKNLLLSATEEQSNRYVEEYLKGAAVSVDGYGEVPSDILELKFAPRAEFAIVVEGNNTVVLDIEIDETLAEEGTLRELIRYVQVARKEADLQIDDRICLSITGSGVEELVDKYKETIKTETLALKLNEGGEYTFSKEVDVNGECIIKVGKAK